MIRNISRQAVQKLFVGYFSNTETFEYDFNLFRLYRKIIYVLPHMSFVTLTSFIILLALAVLHRRWSQWTLALYYYLSNLNVYGECLYCTVLDVIKCSLLSLSTHFYFHYTNQILSNWRNTKQFTVIPNLNTTILHFLIVNTNCAVINEVSCFTSFHSLSG